MIKSLLLVLGAGLSIWDHKEKNKYAEKKAQLERDWYEEYNKPDEKRSLANLDRIEFELCVLARSFASEVGASDSGNRS